MNPFDLSGRSALVTGSSRGIGRGIADALREAGANVIYQSRQPPPDDLPPGVTCLRTDLAEADAPAKLMEDTFAHAPDLDILVCNAGSYFEVPFLEMTQERYAQTMDLNVRAPFFIIQRFAQQLVAEKRGGAVVIVSSTNGFHAEYESAAYDVSKGGLVMMTKTLALNLAEFGIRVNAVAPGLIRTPLTERWIDSNHEMRHHYEKQTPLGRIGNLNDCAGAAVYLVAEASSYVTGHTIVVDGGLTLPQIGKL